MSTRRHILPAVFALLLLGIPASGLAEWIEFGIPVCQLGADQSYQELASDGQGGVIVVYESGAPTDIYAQRMDPYGNALWIAGGVPVCNWTGYQGRPCITADGQGGAVIAWFDWRNGNTDIYAQRVDQNGNRLWTAGGVALCTQAAAQWNPRCASDGAGGAIVAWRDDRGVDFDIYAQRIDQGGTVRWTADGVRLTNAAGAQDNVQVTADGYGGAIFVWQGGDVAIQKVNATGTVQWAAAGNVIAASATSPFNPVITAETPYGFYLAWEARNGAVDDGIYAQRIDLYGNPRWAGGGVQVNDQLNDQENPVLVPDGQGGVVVAWLDRRAGGATADIYAQKLNLVGALQWTATGAPVCVDTYTQYYPQIVSDGTGGALIGWYDDRAGYDDVVIQHLDTGGTAQWLSAGLPVGVDHLQQYWVRMLPDGLGGALMAWMDSRAGNVDIYAQRIDRFGYWGYPAPLARSATDVPGDQGGRLTLAWDASRLDPWPYQQISRYTLWKSLTGAAAQELLAAGAHLLAGPQAILDAASNDAAGLSRSAAPVPVILPPLDANGAQDKSEATYYWELVGIQDAYHLPAYAATLDTDCDSTALADCDHHFQVIAHTADPLKYWIGAPVSGHSVDNLAPEKLTGLSGAGSYGPPAMTVAWDPSLAADLSCYAVHRGLTPDFIPGQGNLIATPTDTFFADGLWDPDNINHYKVAAVDIHGNTGPWALLLADRVTGVGGGAPVPVAVLRQNVPNPFNPRTTIRFDLPAAGQVHLAVYDLAGRLVRVLVEGEIPAGSHEAVWDGRDRSGRAAPSGSYLARLVAGGTVEGVRLSLVR